MSYKQILTTNDIGAGENQVAAGNHKQAYTSSECTTYTSDDNKIGITPAAVKKAFTIFEPKPHNHDSNYVKKTGDTMTGSLWINNNDGLYIQKNGQNWIGLTRDSSGSQYYGLWDCLANTWLLATDGSYTRLQENVYINKELIVDKNISVEKAMESDYSDIVDLLMSDEEKKKVYSRDSLYNQLKQRNMEKYGRNYIIKDNNKVIAHAGTGDENSLIAVINSVIVNKNYRRRGLATVIVKKLCEDLLLERKICYLMVLDNEAEQLYKKIGFYEKSTYGKLIRR